MVSLKQLKRQVKELHEEGKDAEALELLEREELEQDVTAPFCFLKAKVLVALERYDEAVEELEEALDLDPDHSRSERLLRKARRLKREAAAPVDARSEKKEKAAAKKGAGKAGAADGTKKKDPEAMVPCPVCSTSLKRKNLNKHLTRVHPDYERPKKAPESLKGRLVFWYHALPTNKREGLWIFGAFCTLLLVGLAIFVFLDDTVEGTVVVFETEFGTFEVELYDDDMPITTENFLRYVDDRFYDNTVIHRIVRKESMEIIQGGGYDRNEQRKIPTYPEIELEDNNDHRNTRGTIAMARTNDPDTARAEFFINLKHHTHLDGSGDGTRDWYAVFGHVISGMDVVEEINGVPLEQENDEAPVDPPLIYKVYIKT